MSPRFTSGSIWWRAERKGQLHEIYLHTYPFYLSSAQQKPARVVLLAIDTSPQQHLSTLCSQPVLLPSATWAPSPWRAPQALQQEPAAVGHTACILLRASSSSSRDQPVEPGLCCTQVGARELQAQPGCSCIEQYWFWQWLEHFGFCIRVILTWQFHKMQLRFKWPHDCFPGTSISLQFQRCTEKKKQSKFGWESTRFNKFKPLASSGFFCYLNRKLHGFRQSAHLQFFSLLFFCCWEPQNVLPCQLLKCF